MSQRNNLYTDNFRQALVVQEEPRKFIELVARALGSSARDLFEWSQSFETDEELEMGIKEVLKDGGVDDEWKFLWSVCGDATTAKNRGTSESAVGTSSADCNSHSSRGAVEKKTAEAAVRLIGKKIHELLDTLVNTLSGAVMSGGNKCIIIQGESMSGKTTFLRKMIEKLREERGISSVHYRELTLYDSYPVFSNAEVITLDDADVEITASAVENKITKYYRSKNHVMIFTCRDTGKLQNLITMCDALVYTLPEPSETEMITILSRITLRGYLVSSGTTRKILNFLTAFGSSDKLAKGIDIIRILLYPHLYADFKQGLIRAETHTIHFKKADVEKAVSQVIGVRVLPVAKETETRLRNEIERYIKGQGQVIDDILPSLVSIAAGLTDPSRPAGVFLFYGPSGCGKTECGRVIANILFNGVLHKEDMNTYSEKHSISRITGAPPGYMGYSDTPSLIECIDAHPRGVLLLDEIEKSHETVMDHIMELADTGMLRDTKGKLHDARGFLIICTSNVTCEQKNEVIPGFERSCVDIHSINPRDELANSRVFKPEFLGRIQVISRFKELDKKDVKEIAHMMLSDLAKRLRSVGIRTQMTDTCINEIVAAYDAKSGARSMKNYIETHIKNKLLVRRRKKNIPQGV